MAVTPRAASSVVLLGTLGGPGGDAKRSGIATLVRIAGHQWLVDAGDGVVHQLAAAGADERDVEAVFLTHLHDDHTAGLPALMSFRFTRREPPLSIFGPPGTRALVAGALAFLRSNADIRMAEQRNLTPLENLFDVHEVLDGQIFETPECRVAARSNTHFHLAPQGSGASARSYSLRFDCTERSIGFTGDTGPDENLASFFKGANLLVAEMVSSLDISRLPEGLRAHMMEEHLAPEQVGKLANVAGVQTLVLSHVRDVRADDLAVIRHEFRGMVFVGADLQVH